MSNILAPKKIKRKKERAWELDFLRGLCILLVVWDHFMFDVGYLFRYDLLASGKQGIINLSNFAREYFFSDLRLYGWGVVVFLFFFISGICTTFSRSNPLRALKLGIVAALLSLFTHLIDVHFSDGGASIFIKMGVIHCFALCLTLYSVIELLLNFLNPSLIIKKNAKKIISPQCGDSNTKNLEYKETLNREILRLKTDNIYKKKEIIFKVIIGAVFFLVSIVAFIINKKYNAPYWEISLGNKTVPATSEWTGMFVYTRDWWSADYFPLLPFFAFFMLGATAGVAFYPRKKSLLPRLDGKWHIPVSYIGRYTIWIYLLSQVLIFAFFLLIFPLF